MGVISEKNIIVRISGLPGRVISKKILLKNLRSVGQGILRKDIIVQISEKILLEKKSQKKYLRKNIIAKISGQPGRVISKKILLKNLRKNIIRKNLRPAGQGYFRKNIIVKISGQPGWSILRKNIIVKISGQPGRVFPEKIL